LFTREFLLQKFLKTLPENNSQKIVFEILPGENSKKIAQKLINNNFIVSQWAFLKFLQRENLDQKLLAGKFLLSKNLTIPEVVEIITQNKQEQISVLIPEGFRNDQIDARLTELNLISSGEFLRCIDQDFSEFDFLPSPGKREGFFFPDTYFVNLQNFSVCDFAQIFLKNFAKKTANVRKNSPREFFDILKMASIIEKESYDSLERPIISGVLWKRLENNVLLGADATTRYFLKNFSGALTVEELEKKIPGNTRAVLGLPPTAICNPGISAILAAANPQKSDFWYYLHDTKGEIHFGKNLQEHNLNKSKFLK